MLKKQLSQTQMAMAGSCNNPLRLHNMESAQGGACRHASRRAFREYVASSSSCSKQSPACTDGSSFAHRVEVPARLYPKGVKSKPLGEGEV